MHAHYELRDLGCAYCIPVHWYSVRIATGYTDLSQISQITKNTGILPNIIPEHDRHIRTYAGALQE